MSSTDNQSPNKARRRTTGGCWVIFLIAVVGCACAFLNASTVNLKNGGHLSILWASDAKNESLLVETSSSTSTPTSAACECIHPPQWTAQSGQDKFLFETIFDRQDLCCKGFFIEFGARDGIAHSNTFPFEANMGWAGLMFELDPNEYKKLEQNRPGASIIKGAVCPSSAGKEITVLLSKISGHSGSLGQYEETRLRNEREKTVVKCYNLAEELHARKIHRVDYMTMDTEGSEVDLVVDFPWDDFDIRVVQIEQLVASRYPSQAGKKEKIIEHMLSHNYEFFKNYVVAPGDTDDLMFIRNLPFNASTATGRRLI